MKSDKVPMKDYCVVDVRDDDWHGGNIKGSHNSPASIFHAKVDELAMKTKDVPLVVFHCALSQVRYAVYEHTSVFLPSHHDVITRGPKAARVSCAATLGENTSSTHRAQIYAQTCDNLQKTGLNSPHDVCVLTGGFEDFQAKYRKDPHLVENWDAEVWASEWSV